MKHNLLIAILLIIGAILISAVVYTAMKTRDIAAPEMTKVSIMKKNNSMNVNNEINSNGEVAYKIYKNEKYGFEVTIPSDWVVGDPEVVDSAIDDKGQLNMYMISFLAKSKGEMIDVMDFIITAKDDVKRCDEIMLCNVGGEMAQGNGYYYGITHGFQDQQYVDEYITGTNINEEGVKIQESFKLIK